MKKRKNFLELVKENPITSIVFVAGVVALCYLAYSRFVLGITSWFDWTGFGPYTSPTGEYYRARTLWDWLQLLVIPSVLAILALWFNRQSALRERRAAETRHQAEQGLARDRMREESLRSYVEKTTELFSSSDFKYSRKSNVSVIARAHTLLTLRTLDKERKRLLLQFLHEMNLITREKTLLPLMGADLSEVDLGQTDTSTSFLFDLSGINLDGVNLTRASLRYINLSHSGLHKADLSNAQITDADLSHVDLSSAFLQNTRLLSVDLRQANMSQADLSGADLSGSNLGNANLSEAKLRRTNLSEVDLSGADLTGCDLTGARLDNADFTNAKILNVDIDVLGSQFGKAGSLEGLILPDGKRFEDPNSNFGEYLRSIRKSPAK